MIKSGKPVNKNFVYSSNLNENWMSVPELRKWIKKNISDIL